MSLGLTPPSCSPRLQLLRSFFLFLLFLLAVVSAPAAHAQSAATWNKRGQAAEIREDYDTAYEDYRHGV